MYKTKKQAGFSVMQIALVLAFASITAVITLQQFADSMAQSKQESALQEISKVVNAAEVYRQVNRDYAGMSLTVLARDGYAVAPFTGATGENTYGLDADILPGQGDNDATLTYALPDAEACNAADIRVEQLDGILGSDCDGAFLLTATLD